MDQLRARAYLGMLLGQDSSPVLAGLDSPARPGTGTPETAGTPGTAGGPAAGRRAGGPGAGGRTTSAAAGDRHRARAA
jgi:hypothetical protein